MAPVTSSAPKQLVANLAASTLCGLFAYAHLVAFRAHPRPSLGAAVIVEGLFALFMLIRRDSERTTRSPGAWAVAFLGMTLPFLLRPTAASHDLAIGSAIQLFGSTLAVAGVLSLNRCAGIVPAHRGLRTGGLYRLVRHPLYATYTIAHVGYLLSNFTVRNTAVVVLAFAAQLARIRNEERLLSNDRAYVAYQARTRWRLLPYVY